VRGRSRSTAPNSTAIRPAPAIELSGAEALAGDADRQVVAAVAVEVAGGERFA
jgi:hypothetical protein